MLLNGKQVATRVELVWQLEDERRVWIALLSFPVAVDDLLGVLDEILLDVIFASCSSTLLQILRSSYTTTFGLPDLSRGDAQTKEVSLSGPVGKRACMRPFSDQSVTRTYILSEKALERTCHKGAPHLLQRV